MKSSVLNLTFLIIFIFIIGCASSKQDPEDQSINTQTPKGNSATDSETLVEKAVTEPVAASWVLHSEHGDFEFENLGWKETEGDTVRIFDYTKIKLRDETSYRYRVFKRENWTAPVELEFDDSGDSRLWNLKIKQAALKTSWVSNLNFQDIKTEMLRAAQFRSKRCASHPTSLKYARLGKEGVSSPILLTQDSLFYVGRAITNVVTGLEFETSLSVMSGLKTFIQTGHTSLYDGGDLTVDTRMQVSVITANSSLFMPMPGRSLDLVDSYEFAWACEGAYRTAIAQLGNKSPHVDDLASQLVDRKLSEFEIKELRSDRID